MNKKIISTMIMSVLSTAGAVGTATSSDLKLTFADNTTSVWGAGKEFAFTTNYGSVNDGAKDIFFGGETWTFQGASTSNMVGGLLTAVSQTNSNAGTGTRAPITSGQAGFPICGTPGTCDVLQQNALLFGAPITFLAPTVGSVAATAYDSAMKILAWDESGTAASVQIWLPVAQFQWAGSGGIYHVGADPTRTNRGPTGDKITFGIAPTGPGLTFIGSASGGIFHLTASSIMTYDEGSVPSFAAENNLNWDIRGSYDITSQVPVPAAVWLFGSGLIGLICAVRRKTT